MKNLVKYLILLLILLLAAVWSIGRGMERSPTLPGVEVKNGSLPEESKAEGPVDYQITMNVKPVFADGGAEGDVCIANSPDNKDNMQVEYILKDTEESIYQSDIFEPGTEIYQGSLTKTLQAGTYQAIARTTIINPETGERAGRADTDIIITVSN